MPTKVITVNRRALTWWEKLYIGEVVKGLMLTSGVFFKNFALHTAHLFGFKKNTPAMATWEYPERPRPLPARYRTRHRLMKLENGTERCVACMMCETVCPAYCIEIIAEERTDGYTEKRPKSFVVDLGKCIYCGACVEVCPCDAIRMDTRILSVAAGSRESMIYSKDDLLNWEEMPDGSVVDLARRAALKFPEEVKASRGDL